MNIIKVPQEKLVALIEKAYDLSRAQGMGLYHYVAGPLPEGQAQAGGSTTRFTTGRNF